MNSEDQTQLISLKQVIDSNPGSTDVVLVIGKPENKQIIKLPTGIRVQESTVSQLKDIVGNEYVVMQ